MISVFNAEHSRQMYRRINDSLAVFRVCMITVGAPGPAGKPNSSTTTCASLVRGERALVRSVRVNNKQSSYLCSAAGRVD